MEELRIGLWGLLIANIVFGFLFGTFPLVAGLLSGNKKYAFLGFVISVAGGAILGVFLSYPLAMIFLWLILKKPAEQVAGEAVASSTETEAAVDTV